jgi:hypothetical protein
MNSVGRFEAQLRQVDADQPKLLAVAYHFMVHGSFTPGVATTVVQRLKRMFTRADVSMNDIQTWKRSKAYTSGSRRSAKYDTHNFWAYHFKDEPLTEAGWRYLVKLPYDTLRTLCQQPWRAHSTFKVLNLLARLQVPPVSYFEFALVENLAFLLDNNQSRHQFVLAFREAKLAGHEFTAEEEDFLYDLFQSDRELLIGAGRTWANLVADAQEFMANAALLEKAELEGYRWRVPLAPFASVEGVTVRILADGAELLEEGIELKNCLRKMTHYAARATRGECLLAALRGSADGTAEVVRGSKGAWEVSQVAKPGNVKVFAGFLWNAANELATRLNEQERVA